MGVTFCIPKTELIHCRSPRENYAPSQLPVVLQGLSFPPTPLSSLHREACLPPLSSLVTLRRRQAALRVLSSPPEIKPAISLLPSTVPTFASHRTTRPPHPKVGTKPYLYFHLAWDVSPDKV